MYLYKKDLRQKTTTKTKWMNGVSFYASLLQSVGCVREAKWQNIKEQRRRRKEMQWSWAEAKQQERIIWEPGVCHSSSLPCNWALSTPRHSSYPYSDTTPIYILRIVCYVEVWGVSSKHTTPHRWHCSKQYFTLCITESCESAGKHRDITNKHGFYFFSCVNNNLKKNSQLQPLS